jgi:predicted protein tyrosine phosphatase
MFVEHRFTSVFDGTWQCTMFILASWTKSGYVLQRVLRFLLPCILLVTGSSLLTASKLNIHYSNIWLFNVFGFANLNLFILWCFVKRIGNDRIQRYSVVVNFVGIFMFAVMIKNMLACTIVVVTFWLPLAAHVAAILYIPSISEIRINDMNHSSQPNRLFFLGNAAVVTTNESNVLKECNITHILELTDGRSRNNPSKVPYNIILSQRMVSDVIGDKSPNDLFAIASQLIEFMKGCQKNNGTLLIHCSSGIALSTKFAIFYLVKEQYVPNVYNAYDLIRKSRPIVDVSLHDLKVLEKELRKTK